MLGFIGVFFLFKDAKHRGGSAAFPGWSRGSARARGDEASREHALPRQK